MVMNNNRIINLNIKIALLLLSMGFASCKKDYLTVQPKDQVTDAILWSSTDNADVFLNNIYGSIPGSFNSLDPQENFSDNSINGIMVAASQTIYATSIYTANDGISFNSAKDYGDTQGEGWDALYTDIRKCNLFIQKVTDAHFSDATWEKQRLAEARFLRAYFYQSLWIQYGGVPIITEVLNVDTQGDAIFRARNTDTETFQFIDDECGAIANDLPVTAEAGRITKGAALALKGWCELFEASPLKNPSNDKTKWALAAATNKEIIDMGVYSLFPDYNALFYEENNNNEEVIFAKEYLGKTSLGSSKEVDWGPPALGLFQTGGILPTQEVVDEYAMSNGLQITDPASGYDPQNPFLNREKRFYESIVYDGSMWTGYLMSMRQGSGLATSLNATSQSRFIGYFMRKGLSEEYSSHPANSPSSANEIIYRYAEVLLSYAEAQNEAVGPDISVYEAINQVRVRSDLPPLPAGLSQIQMRDAIYRERRVELAFENKRFYDLLRLKLAEEKLNGSLHAILIKEVNNILEYSVIPALSGSRKFYANKNYLLPIPQSAIDQNSKLVQNPNY